MLLIWGQFLIYLIFQEDLSRKREGEGGGWRGIERAPSPYVSLSLDFQNTEICATFSVFCLVAP